MRDSYESRKKLYGWEYGEIKASIRSPKFLLTSPSIAATYLIFKINVQRSSLDEGVEPQANGGRKIPLLYFYRMYTWSTHVL